MRTGDEDKDMPELVENLFTVFSRKESEPYVIKVMKYDALCRNRRGK